MNDTVKIAVLVITWMTCYVIESVFLAGIASKNGRSPLLAWVPVLNYFLIRDLAGKKSRWQWLLGFLLAALLGNPIISWFGTAALMWSSVIWYWTAFDTIMKAETDMGPGWLFGSIICLPVKLYVMYRMAE